MKGGGVVIFTVGVGDGVKNVELETIASRKAMYYPVPTYTDLLSTVDALCKHCCQGSIFSDTIVMLVERVTISL